jgi:membrane protease YdiL (CAAX protease family)
LSAKAANHFMLFVFWTLLSLLLFAPGLKTAPRLVLLAAVLYGLGKLAVVSPAWWTKQFGLHGNWLGKLLAIELSLAIIYWVRLVSPQESGLQRPQPDSWRMVGLVALAAVTLQLSSGYLMRHQVSPPSAEALLYQLTMPGLAEELFERGVLLGLLSKVFPRTIPFFGTRTSWGGLVGVCLFILGHGFAFAHPDTFWPTAHFSLGRIADKLLFGTLFLWVRERSGSCWAAVATHNLTNFSLFLGQFLP